MARNPQPSGRRSSGERAANPALIPAIIALILIGGAIAVALMTKRPEVVVDASPAKPRPFAELPPEAVPAPREREAKPDLPLAPESLASEPQWVNAQTLAAEAGVLYDEALAARAKGDVKLAQQKSDAAHSKFNAAVEASADWEESLLSKYNENDEQIRAIKDTRTAWLEKLRQLEKGVGH